MFARATVVEGSADKVDAGIESFKTGVVPAVKAVDGYRGALLLVNRSNGKGIGMTLWETEDARARGAEAVAEARRAALELMGSGDAAAQPADEYEVGVLDMP